MLAGNPMLFPFLVHILEIQTCLEQHYTILREEGNKEVSVEEESTGLEEAMAESFDHG